MMRYLWRSPALSLSVFLLWLLLVGELSLAQLAFAALLGAALPWFTDVLRRDRAGIRQFSLLVKLAPGVLWDIVLSNLELACRILAPPSASTPGFVWIPLELTNPYGIAVLAHIITLTPGTVSADLSGDRRYLLVHCFHLADPVAVVNHIKRRYEAPLRKIFP